MDRLLESLSSNLNKIGLTAIPAVSLLSIYITKDLQINVKKVEDDEYVLELPYIETVHRIRGIDSEGVKREVTRYLHRIGVDKLLDKIYELELLMRNKGGKIESLLSTGNIDEDTFYGIKIHLNGKIRNYTIATGDQLDNELVMGTCELGNHKVILDSTSYFDTINEMIQSMTEYIQDQIKNN